MADSWDRIIVLGAGVPAAAVARAVAEGDLPVALIEEREPVRAVAVGESGWYSPWVGGGSAALVRLATQGIDLLEQVAVEVGPELRIDRRGQLIVATGIESGLLLREAVARFAAVDGGGPLREHVGPQWYLPSPLAGTRGVPGGVDLFEAPGLGAAFPFLGERARLGIHVRRAGQLDARALRRWLLGAARAAGAAILADTITGVDAGGLDRWTLTLGSGTRVSGRAIVIAGHRGRSLGRRLGLDLAWAEGSRLIASLDDGGRFLPPAAPMVVLAEETPGPAAVLGLPAILVEEGRIRMETVIPPSRSDQLMALGEQLFRRAAEVVPSLAGRRGPPGQVTVASAQLGLPASHRPLIGLADRRGVYLATGLGGGVTLALIAADAVATALRGLPLPAAAAPFAPLIAARGPAEGGSRPG